MALHASTLDGLSVLKWLTAPVKGGRQHDGSCIFPSAKGGSTCVDLGWLVHPQTATVRVGGGLRLAVERLPTVDVCW